MFKVFIPQKNLVLNAEANKNLMDLLLENQLPVASTCQGEGICSKCVMQITPTGQPNELEKRTMEKNKCEPNHRLSCQIFIQNDLTVTASYW